LTKSREQDFALATSSPELTSPCLGLCPVTLLKARLIGDQKFAGPDRARDSENVYVARLLVLSMVWAVA
jgi:hypothetical protein